MPANVTIEFGKAQKKFEEAKTLSEKLAALQEMRSTAPSHKGAEKLRAEITKKLAAVKREMEKQKEQSKKRGTAPRFHVRKEGAGQVVLVGMPSSGKSTLLNALTGLKTKVGNYPFTTKAPVAGMMNYRGANVQVVEVPAIVKGSAEGKANGAQVLSVIRSSDAVAILAKGKKEAHTIREELRKANIIVGRERPKIEIAPSKFRGISIAGKELLRMKEPDLISMLKGVGMFNVSVILGEEATVGKVAEVLDSRIVYKKSIVVNAEKKKGLEALKEEIFGLLGRILVYTKKPGEEADMSEPLVLKKGATVEDVAAKLHKDFARNLRYVRVWGSSKFPGQRVSRDYELKDRDIIEIYG